MIERQGVLKPKGYSFYVAEDHQMMGNGKEEFNMINRCFEDVDGYFSEEINAAIIDRLKVPRMQVYVLDLAGGTESRAVKDIKEKFGNWVCAINLDFVQDIVKGKEALRLQADAAKIPLAGGSLDIIYSRQLLPFLLRFKWEHPKQVEKVLAEVARVLKPGGIAFLDDEEELSGPKTEKRRQELAGKLGVVLETHDSPNEKYGERNFPNFIKIELRLEKFLVMKKE